MLEEVLMDGADPAGSYENITLSFHADRSISGNDGCSPYAGTYETRPNETITLRRVTKVKECRMPSVNFVKPSETLDAVEVPQDNLEEFQNTSREEPFDNIDELDGLSEAEAFVQTIEVVETYRVEENGDRLVLLFPYGALTFTSVPYETSELVEPNYDGEWTLIRGIDEVSKQDGLSMKLSGSTVSGFDGCSTYNAQLVSQTEESGTHVANIETDVDAEGTVSLVCDRLAARNLFIKTLTEPHSVTVDGSRLTVLARDAEVEFVFEKNESSPAFDGTWVLAGAPEFGTTITIDATEVTGEIDCMTFTAVLSKSAKPLSEVTPDDAYCETSLAFQQDLLANLRGATSVEVRGGKVLDDNVLVISNVTDTQPDGFELTFNRRSPTQILTSPDAAEDN